MGGSVLLVFLCVAAEARVGKHVYNSGRKTWIDAQSHCMNNYGELSFVTSQKDQDNLIKAAGDNDVAGWIGLYRDPSNITRWKWSGGGTLTYENWALHQPDNFQGVESVGELFSSGKWNDNDPELANSFYCFKINVVDKTRTWEEALEHCQNRRKKLASVTSRMERLHAQNVMKRYETTDPVWIGLRYLKDQWRWMTNESIRYVDWPQGQDHLCPMRRRCGALTKTSGWVNRDCEEKLNFICV